MQKGAMKVSSRPEPRAIGDLGDRQARLPQKPLGFFQPHVLEESSGCDSMPDDEELVQPVTREIENAGELLHFWRRFALHALADVLAGDR